METGSLRDAIPEVIQEVVNIRLEFLLYIEKISRDRIEKNIILLVSIIIKAAKNISSLDKWIEVYSCTHSGILFILPDN